MRNLLQRITAFCLCITLLAPIAISSEENDAGSGRDAPGHETQAYALPGYGTYSGFLSDHDRDSYRLDASHASATCVRADISSSATGNANLTLASADAKRRVFADFGPAGAARIAIAAPSVGSTSYRLHNHDPLDAGTYSFSLSRLRSADIGSDAGTSGDAPALLAQASPVDAGCNGGTIGRGTDMRDAFQFTADEGQYVVLSYAQAGAETLSTTLQLLSSDGSTLLTLASGQVGSVQVPSTDSYYIVASTPSMSLSTSSSTYLFGLGIGPPEDPCRPYCITMS